jgi:hypothetical protein
VIVVLVEVLKVEVELEEVLVTDLVLGLVMVLEELDLDMVVQEVVIVAPVDVADIEAIS